MFIELIFIFKEHIIDGKTGKVGNSNIFLFLIIKERTKRENTAEKYFTKEKEKYYFRKISIRKRQSKY